MPRRMMARGGDALVLSGQTVPLRRGEVRVRTTHSVISPGTELSIIAATRESVAAAHEYPNPHQTWRQSRDPWSLEVADRPHKPRADAASLGYSLTGEVIEVGEGVSDIALGMRVACSGSQCCFHCTEVVVPRSLLVPVPAAVPAEDAAHVTLGAIATEAFRRTGCTLGETLLILGVGMLGLLITQLARCAGVYSIGLDRVVARRQLARSMGAILELDAVGPDAVLAVQSATSGFGADAVVIAAAGSGSELVNFAFDAVRPGGRVVALGDFGMSLDRQRFFGSRATLVPAIAYGPGRYDPVYEEGGVDYPIDTMRWTENRNMGLFLRLVEEGRVDLSELPRLHTTFEEGPSAYAILRRAPDVLTAVLAYPPST